eukprot:127998_1
MSNKSVFSRSASGSLQRRMTNQGKLYLSAESEANVPATGVCVIIDGILSIKILAKILNNKLITKYDRFKSTATKNGFYKLIDNFDCTQILTHYKINKKELSKHNIDIISTPKLQIIEQYIAIHISKYHNYLFTKRNKLPLWRGHLLTFPQLQLSVFYLKSHHCICDGITMGDIFLSLSDNYETVINQMKEKRNSLNKYKKYKKQKDEINTSWYLYIQWILFLFWIFLKFIWFTCKTLICRKEPQSILKPSKTSVHKSFAVLFHDLQLKNINEQRYKYLQQNDIKITFNDYMITVIGEGLNNFLSQVKVKQNIDIPTEIGTLIPMNTRDPLSDSISFGNQVGLLNIFIPFNLKSTKEAAAFERRLYHVKTQMDYIKDNMFAMLSVYSLNLLGYLPKYLTFFWLNNVEASTVISNVAGPNKKLIFGGEDVLKCFGIVQNQCKISVTFSVVTYNGTTSISCYADNNINGENTAKDIIKCIENVLIQRKCMPENK